MGGTIGAGLKVIHVLRKPCSESTVAANVIKFGCGAVNIDGCRVRLAEGETVTAGLSNPANRVGVVGRDLGFTGNDVEAFQQAQRESIERANTLGRWPANVILTHAPGCGDECAHGCPVAALDAQSGTSSSAKGKQSYKRAETTSWKERGGSFTPGSEWEAEGFGDTGGASRFFKQIKL